MAPREIGSEEAVAADGEETSEPGSMRAIFGFAIRFVAILLALSALLVLDDLRDGPATRQAIPIAAAKAVAATMNTLGLPTTSRGTYVTYAGNTLEIVRSCLAIEVHMLFISAVLAFPVGWRAKAKGIAIGVTVLLLVNHLRIMTLVLLAPRSEQALEIGHIYVWPLILILVANGLWLAWIRSVDAPHLGT